MPRRDTWSLPWRRFPAGVVVEEDPHHRLQLVPVAPIEPPRRRVPSADPRLARRLLNASRSLAALEACESYEASLEPVPVREASALARVLDAQNEEERGQRYAGFATKHGFLTDSAGPEPVSMWDREISALHCFVVLAQVEAAGSGQRLAQLLEAEQRFPQQPVDPAFLGARTEVVERLRGHMTAEEARTWARDLMDHLFDRVAREHFRHNFRAAAGSQPDCLIGLIWLSTVESQRTGKPPRDCDRCRQAFQPDPRSKSGRDRFCSDACKMAYQRQRKNDATELLRMGVDPSEVAERTGARRTTVDRWASQVSTAGTQDGP